MTGVQTCALPICARVVRVAAAGLTGAGEFDRDFRVAERSIIPRLGALSCEEHLEVGRRRGEERAVGVKLAALGREDERDVEELRGGK